MKRKSRLFAMAEALRARRTGVTAETLAQQFGITVRTAYRDLAALQEAGLPLHADRGRGGGYALDKSYQLPPVNFTAREAAVLVTLAQSAVTLRTLPFTETLSLASNKVRAALSVSTQRELFQLLKQLQIVGVPALPTSAKVQKAIETALFENRTLRIEYEKSPGVIAPRSIRRVICERSVTLLNCDDIDLGEQRQFRLDKVKSATLIS
jgi:predicted DNA-binding transcriptional regulator YafY